MSLDKYRTTNTVIADTKAALSAGLPIVRLSKLTKPLDFRLLPAMPDWPLQLDTAPHVQRAPNSPFVFIWKHVYSDPAGDGYIAFACPERNGAGVACPACAEAKRELARDDKSKIGWDMRASRVALVNILVLDGVDELRGRVATLELSSPAGKPTGRTQFEKLLAAAEHPRNGGEVFDPVVGHVITASKSGSGRDTNYDFGLDIRRGSHPLADGDDAIVELIESQPDIMAALAQDIQAGQTKARELAAPAAQPPRRSALPMGAKPKASGRAEDELFDDLEPVDEIDY